MTMERRQLLQRAAAFGAAALPWRGTAAAAADPTPLQRLQTRARESLQPLAFDGAHFAGPGWNLLLNESRRSEFVLLGEDHGMAEVPALARELFLALQSSGFDRLALEVSPPIADDLDRAARTGVAGLKRFFDENPPGAAFYNMEPEAAMVAAVRASTTGAAPVLWGLDYAVIEDRRLIARLQAAQPPAAARAPLAALAAASAAAWTSWSSTHDPAMLFCFSADPALVRAVSANWPRPDLQAAVILETLDETLTINQLRLTSGHASNQRRAALMRRNLLRHLRREEATGRNPKVMVKIGAFHATRGVTQTGVFDIGTLVPELAALRGGTSFNLMVIGGASALQAQLDPRTMTVTPVAVELLAELGLQALAAVLPDTPGPVLLDLRPLRPLLSGTRLLAFDPRLVQFVHGYDVLVVWNGATASTMF